MFDLTDGQLEEVRRILAEHVPDCEVFVFGSRAKGTNKPYSDLDLALRCGGEIEFSRRNRLEEAFEHSELPFRVDIVDLVAQANGRGGFYLSLMEGIMVRHCDWEDVNK